MKPVNGLRSEVRAEKLRLIQAIAALPARNHAPEISVAVISKAQSRSNLFVY